MSGAANGGANGATALPTGFPELDQLLGGGWQVGALHELLCASEGSGVLEALLPALFTSLAAGACDGGPPRLVAWIHPSRLPYPPALYQAGLDLARCLFVRPRDAQEQAWAIDLALRSGACDLVVTWLNALDDRSLRRLQLAAEAGGAVGVVLRPQGFARQPSPAAVRLLVAPLPSLPSPPARSSSEPASGRLVRRRLQVTPLRCRGGAPLGAAPIVLEWSRDPLDEPAPAALRAGAATACLPGPRDDGVRAVGA
ncbi:MAG: SOS cell division inhibitor SulA [Planctomycetes bacterium]|nr:SOS cell division inhibitor SulA [Planctomycetota bacterium]